MTYNVYWGDLHSHCSISYGEGTVAQAVARARQQLDFCSITGHAFWPDMPTDRDRYGAIIDYHNEGFARLAANWSELLRASSDASVEDEFLVLPSYEWHSLEFGDHNVYAATPELELRDAPDLPALRAWASDRDALVIPHHIGYAAGYRGIDWRHFDETRSPVVEIHSLHGCSESEEAPYRMYHDMGPRDFGSTAVAGWEAGHRFGVIASTDHHGGYPGSHGDGRVAVLASALTRESIWEAIKGRRVYAVTGDKIDVQLLVNDAWMGSEIESDAKRRIVLRVRGSAALDRVELLKNDRLLRRFFPQPAADDVGQYRFRITWGWGRKDEAAQWMARLQLSEGELVEVEPCFSGQSIVAPQGVGGHAIAADEADRPHEITEFSTNSLAWRSVTTGNRSTRHPTTQALSLLLAAPLSARVTLDVNNCRIERSLGDVLRRGHVNYCRGWLSEAIRVGPLEPVGECQVTAEMSDSPETDCDRYRVRVAQQNGQWAWSSPIWAAR